MADKGKAPRIRLGGSGALAQGLQKAFDAFSDYLDKLAGVTESNKVEPGANTIVSRTNQGTVIEHLPPVETSVSACPHTFTLEGGGSAGTVRARLLHVGAIYPMGIATNAVASDIPWKSLPFSKETTKWIRAKITTDGTTGTTWELETSDTPAAPFDSAVGAAPPLIYIDLAVVVKGVIKRIAPCAHLRIATKLALVTDKATPACEESPTLNHYTWEVFEV